jgi:hypothetical protein
LFPFEIWIAIAAVTCIAILFAKFYFLDGLVARRRWRKFQARWHACADNRGFAFKPWAFDEGRNETFKWPEVEGLHRGRKFGLQYQFDEEEEIAPQPWGRVSSDHGDCAHVVFTKRELPRLLRRITPGEWVAGSDLMDDFFRARGYSIADRSKLGRFKLQTTSLPFVERLLAGGELAERISRTLGSSAASIGVGRDVAFAYFDWFGSEPERVLKVLDLLCDLADAAERAAASESGSPARPAPALPPPPSP